MLKFESFQPEVIIVDHFGEIVNHVDIKTETLLCEKSLSEDKRKTLNNLRDEQLKKIKEIQERNLFNVKFNEDAYESKWSHVINDCILTYEEKLEAIKEELILFDCVLIEDKNLASGLALWVMRGFFSQKSLKFLW